MGAVSYTHLNELQEWEHDYAGFAKIAAEEGFDLISKTFEMIAGIEKTHADRFQRFATLMEQDQLFSSSQEETWMCLNCGQIIHATMAQMCIRDRSGPPRSPPQRTPSPWTR